MASATELGQVPDKDFVQGDMFAYAELHQQQQEMQMRSADLINSPAYDLLVAAQPYTLEIAQKYKLIIGNEGVTVDVEKRPIPGTSDTTVSYGLTITQVTENETERITQSIPVVRIEARDRGEMVVTFPNYTSEQMPLGWISLDQYYASFNYPVPISFRDVEPETEDYRERAEVLREQVREGITRGVLHTQELVTKRSVQVPEPTKIRAVPTQLLPETEYEKALKKFREEGKDIEAARRKAAGVDNGQTGGERKIGKTPKNLSSEISDEIKRVKAEQLVVFRKPREKMSWDEIREEYAGAFVEIAQQLEKDGFSGVKVIQGLQGMDGATAFRVVWEDKNDADLIYGIYGSGSASTISLIHTAGLQGWQTDALQGRENHTLSQRLKHHRGEAKAAVRKYMKNGDEPNPLMDEEVIYPLPKVEELVLIEINDHAANNANGFATKGEIFSIDQHGKVLLHV